MSRLRPLAAALLVVASSAFADQTVFYPTQDDALFSISAPNDWEFAAAQEEEDYFTLTSESDAVLYFRAVAAADIDAVIKETEDYINETYKDVEIGEAKETDVNGLPGFLANGVGTDKESGDRVTFGFAWIRTGDKVAEIWFEALADDHAGIDGAQKILDTLEISKN